MKMWWQLNAEEKRKRLTKGFWTLVMFVTIITIAVMCSVSVEQNKPSDEELALQAQQDAEHAAARAQRDAEQAAAHEEEIARYGSDPIGAFVYARFFVKDVLVAPRTAKFPGYSKDAVTYLGDETYRVRSYVDSQNSFGALIRTNYTVVIQKGDGKWILKSIDI